ncbi:MAG: YceI family protein [Bacteroidetes bacterium]|nr:YceI family protein [Bacteroidota bacterium]MDA0888944.1 YceI family protein [Bacteroidota bacterium]MDA1084737.1 YceI family protein [Bacteroidota bacterium]
MNKILFLLLSVPVLLTAQQLRIDTSNSYITYEASHPVHDWSGTSDAVQGVVITENDIPTRMAIAATVSSFNSKNSNRDAHALEILDALLFPKVSFYSEEMVLNKDSLNLNGELKFHGVSIPLETIASWSKSEDTYVLEGEFNVQPSKFDIKLPSFMLVKMRDNMRIRFRLELLTFVP